MAKTTTDDNDDEKAALQLKIDSLTSVLDIATTADLTGVTEQMIEAVLPMPLSDMARAQVNMQASGFQMMIQIVTGQRDNAQRELDALNASDAPASTPPVEETKA